LSAVAWNAPPVVEPMALARRRNHPVKSTGCGGVMVWHSRIDPA